MSGERWTKEPDAQLCMLRDHGYSSTEIAAKLGVSTQRRHWAREPARAGKAGQASENLVPVLDSKSDAPVTLFDLLSHHCRWPVQDAPYLFCGDVKQDGSSYCSRHFGDSRRRMTSPP